jgi:hypothetical protein
VKIFLTTVQIAALLIVQLLFPAAPPVATSVVHKPLTECATAHQCGCPAEQTARKACCCAHGSQAQPEKNPLEKFLSAVHCSSATQTPGVFVVQFDFLIPQGAGVCETRPTGETIFPTQQVHVSRDIEPPDPPPRLAVS